jgi:hypothetical protein
MIFTPLMLDLFIVIVLKSQMRKVSVLVSLMMVEDLVDVVNMK